MTVAVPQELMPLELWRTCTRCGECKDRPLEDPEKNFHSDHAICKRCESQMGTERRLELRKGRSEKALAATLKEMDGKPPISMIAVSLGFMKAYGGLDNFLQDSAQILKKARDAVVTVEKPSGAAVRAAGSLYQGMLNLLAAVEEQHRKPKDVDGMGSEELEEIVATVLASKGLKIVPVEEDDRLVIDHQPQPPEAACA